MTYYRCHGGDTDTYYGCYRGRYRKSHTDLLQISYGVIQTFTMDVPQRPTTNVIGGDTDTYYRCHRRRFTMDVTGGNTDI